MIRKATRQDVARRAGVSGATVSRVYNHPDQVEAATRSLVLECARELGFVPDRNAMALRKRRSGVVLLVEIPGQYEYDWAEQREYHALSGEIVRSLMHRAGSGWGSPDRLPGGIQSLQLLSLDNLDDIPRLASQLDFDGILGFGIDSIAAARALEGLGKPVVVCHHTEEIDGVHRVATDNRAGGALSARCLWDRGGRRAVFAGDWFDRVGSHRRRLEGFRQAWPGPAPELLDHCLGIAAGRRLGRQLARRIRSGQVDCIGAVNDLTALGLYQGLQDEGLRVPGDCLICGYDNLPLFRDLCGLPTVEAHLGAIYLQALETLAGLIESPARPAPPRCTTIQPELVG